MTDAQDTDESQIEIDCIVAYEKIAQRITGTLLNAGDGKVDLIELLHL